MTRQAYRLASWTVYPDSNEITRDGQSIRLESRVMNLLVYLCEHPNQVISQTELLQANWGRTEISANSLSVAIAAIRQALGDDAQDPTYIETFKKRGYRLLVTPKKLTVSVTPHGRRRKVFLAAAAISVLVILIVIVLLDQSNGVKPESYDIRLAPIENGTGIATNNMVSETIGDVLIAELARNDHFVVRRAIPDRLVDALALEEPPGSARSNLIGRVVLQEGGFVLTLHLVGQETAQVIWAATSPIRQDKLIYDVASIADGLSKFLDVDQAGPTPLHNDPDEADALYERARQLASVVSNVTIKLAHELLRQAIEIDPQHGAARALLAEMYSWNYPVSFWGLEGDRYDLAETQLELARRYGADEAYLLVTEAGIHLARDREYAVARDLLRRAAVLRPDDPWVLRPQIWANMLLGDFEAALDYNERAAKASLDARSVYLERIVPLYYLGRFDEAARLHAATVELGLKPQVQGPMAAIMAGDILAGFKHWVHFVRQQGVEIEDESEPLSWIEAGEIAGAYEWLRGHSGEFLEDWNYSWVSASWHVSSGNHDLAVKELTAAIKMYRMEQEPQGAASYGWTLFMHDPLFADVRRDPRLVEPLNLLRDGANRAQ